jgi:serine/threonine-protein kinase RsbW
LPPGGRCGERPDETDAATITVEIAASAQSRLIPTVRTLVSDLTTRADFDLDFISDVRMAVDEACTMLVNHADQNEMLNGRFLLSAGYLKVALGVRPREPHARLDTAGFGWRILSALVDEVATLSPADGGAQLEITLLKRQGPG